MRFSSYFWSKSGGTRVLWGVLSPIKSTARMGDGSRPKMPERTCAPPKKSKANSPRTRDHSRNCSTRSGSRAGKIGLSNSRFRLRRNFRELSNPIFRLSSRSGSSSFARDLRALGKLALMIDDGGELITSERGDEETREPHVPFCWPLRQGFRTRLVPVEHLNKHRRSRNVRSSSTM